MLSKINMTIYGRAEHFRHFLNNVPCSYNITANINITDLLKNVKTRGLKLYPVMIFLLASAVNKIDEMRLTLDDNSEPCVYDTCHPSYTIPNAIADSFSGIWTTASDDFSVFYNSCIEDIANYTVATTYAPKANQPPNTFYVSCTPDIAFTSLSLNMFGGAKCLTPMFTLGKYFSDNNNIMMPLSACLHHAACDGKHIARLYKLVQANADNLFS